jgi:murein L,D-transpeptidase YcbB/YkuD
MTINSKFRLSIHLLVSLILLSFIIGIQSCKKKSRSDMGDALFKKTGNKVFKDVTPEGFAPVFQQVFEQQKAMFNNPNMVKAYYEQHDYDPILVMDHLNNDDIKSLPEYLEKSAEHGLNPKIFKAAQIDTLLKHFLDKSSVKNVDEAYHTLAKLELLAANSFINYANALQYGIINPRRIYANYYTDTKRPDSASITAMLDVKSFKTYLDSIQPKDPQYLAIQKALQRGQNAPGMSKQETERILTVNLERLRWKNKPTGDNYVLVNIPDYTVKVVNDGKTSLQMKVCVGEGRNKDRASNLVEYNDTSKNDRPFSRETPQLNSLIYVAEVNPIWNIPQSIVGKEIIAQAIKDPYYLSNKNIDVYKDGKKIDDPETIDWSKVPLDKPVYEFKQQPGADNSLGKIKFLFKNKTNVYLHDTPAKLAFKQSMRAVSHGCVRLEKPLDFARAMFGNTAKYDTIAKDMTLDKVNPTRLALPKKVPVYITYITCWLDENNVLQFRPDVYALDIVLYAHMQKFLIV